MCVRKQGKTLLKILSEVPLQQRHLGADTKHVQTLKIHNKRESENKSCKNDRNSDINQFPLFPLKTFRMIFRGEGNISLAAGVILATGYLSVGISAVLSSRNKTSMDINSHLSAEVGDGIPAQGTVLLVGGPGVAWATSIASWGEARDEEMLWSPPSLSPLPRSPAGDAPGPSLPPLPSPSHPSCAV